MHIDDKHHPIGISSVYIGIVHRRYHASSQDLSLPVASAHLSPVNQFQAVTSNASAAGRLRQRTVVLNKEYSQISEFIFQISY